ncbi:BAG family molecular chaperone regulator 2-like [Euphorbia lathyris]|uniref:BAG family molecular chaperone regulator 2-like n=1 Tax=Euphorbia lathyris TaxID=212925 RepID=UPI003313EADA
MNTAKKMSDDTSTCTSEWEMRPGGMMVQKRNKNHPDDVPPEIIRVRIAYGGLRYEISVNSQATFGELKKIIKGETGLEPEEQKVLYRGKERGNGEYLDICGVRKGSKVVVIQDPVSIERRYIEMRKNGRIQAALSSISSVSTQLDDLAHQVSAIEKSISKGIKVPELQITTLTEMLIRQAIKLDTISAEGDASTLKSLQGKRVQKCVESLDVLKISNAKVKPVIVTTKWETFDFDPPTPTPAPTAPVSPHWNLLD